MREVVAVLVLINAIQSGQGNENGGKSEYAVHLCVIMSPCLFREGVLYEESEME